jgi:predicted dehydrogenase/threonine dehydrogenase-like Zn-dependent dehydrogenase
MKQVLSSRQGVKLVDVPRPLIQNGHVLVRVSYSLISSGTEASSVSGAQKQPLERAAGEPALFLKLARLLRERGLSKTLTLLKEKLNGLSALGYSCAGTVVEVAEDVTDFKPGDRVACGGGGAASHAEMVLVPRNLVVPVPSQVSLKNAASVAVGAIALQGVRRADPRLGEFTAVVGLGLLGQLTVQILAAANCRVIGIDVDERRVELARQLGAECGLALPEGNWREAVNALTQGRGVDACLVTASSESNAVIQNAMEMTRRKGRVVLIGSVGLGLQRHPFYEKELDFLISCSYGPGRYDLNYENKGVDYPYAYVRWTENRNMAEYLRLLSRGAVRLESILEAEYGLDRVGDAYTRLLSAEADKPIGIVLAYPERRDEDSRHDKVVTIQRASRSRKVRIGLLGAGSFARSNHLPNLKAASEIFELRGVATRTGVSARNLAGVYDAAYATTDFQEVLADPEIDAVIICTRHDLHAKLVLAALSAGKHVFVEKPLCMTRAELNAIKDFQIAGATRAEKSGALDGLPLLMVGYNRRFSPYTERLKAALDKRSGSFLAIYRVNAGHLPAEHWVHGEEGGGRLIGEGCHMLDLLQYLAGSDACQVTAEPLPGESAERKGNDNFQVTLRFADGSVGSLIYTSEGGAALPKENLEVHFDRQSIVLDDFCRLTRYAGAAPKLMHKSMQDKGHRQALEAFGRFLSGRRVAPPMTWDEALAAASHAIEAAESLARRGNSACVEDELEV